MKKLYPNTVMAMNSRALSFLFSFLLILCSGFSTAYSQDEDMIPDSDEPAETGAPVEKTAERLWSISGYIESENFLMPGKGLKKKEYVYVSGLPLMIMRNEEPVNKVEAHGYLDFKVGTDTIHARSAIHGYLYPVGNETWHPPHRLTVNELYIKWLTMHTSLKIGKQIIKWGTADFMNPTSYFSPLDLREILFKDENELSLGVHAVSLAFLFGDFSLELVCVPIPTATLLPGNSSPWHLKMPDLNNGVPIHFHHRDPRIPRNWANVNYGGRFSGTASVVDFSFSAFRGLDRDVLFFPYLDMTGMIPTIYVVPKYRNLTCFGFDIAVSAGDVTIQAEAAYSLNKNSVTVPDINKLKYTGIDSAHYLNFATGINWLIDGEDFNVTVEFNKSIYLKDRERFIDPFISDLLIARIEKRFLSGRLFFRLQGILSLNLDYLVMPAAGYDFMNGFLIEAEGGIFGGGNDTLFGTFDSRDIVRIRAKYQF